MSKSDLQELLDVLERRDPRLPAALATLNAAWVVLALGTLLDDGTNDFRAVARAAMATLGALL